MGFLFLTTRRAVALDQLWGMVATAPPLIAALLCFANPSLVFSLRRGDLSLRRAAGRPLVDSNHQKKSRRDALAAAAASTASCFLAGARPRSSRAADADEPSIMELPGGVQRVDLHVGGGARPKFDDVVLLRMRGLLPDDRRTDDSVFLDTRERPLLFQIGTAGPRAGVVPPGLEQALESMRLGGRALVAVPPDLGYPNGVSRFEASRIGLARLVPSGATLRYEVELLRCVDAVDATPSGVSGRACCTDEAFPCQSRLPAAGGQDEAG